MEKSLVGWRTLVRTQTCVPTMRRECVGETLSCSLSACVCFLTKAPPRAPRPLKKPLAEPPYVSSGTGVRNTTNSEKSICLLWRLNCLVDMLCDCGQCFLKLFCVFAASVCLLASSSHVCGLLWCSWKKAFSFNLTEPIILGNHVLTHLVCLCNI